MRKSGIALLIVILLTITVATLIAQVPGVNTGGEVAVSYVAPVVPVVAEKVPAITFATIDLMAFGKVIGLLFGLVLTFIAMIKKQIPLIKGYGIWILSFIISMLLGLSAGMELNYDILLRIFLGLGIWCSASGGYDLLMDVIKKYSELKPKV